MKTCIFAICEQMAVWIGGRVFYIVLPAGLTNEQGQYVWAYVLMEQ